MFQLQQMYKSFKPNSQQLMKNSIKQNSQASFIPLSHYTIINKLKQMIIPNKSTYTLIQFKTLHTTFLSSQSFMKKLSSQIMQIFLFEITLRKDKPS
jgi:hypothetical protein